MGKKYKPTAIIKGGYGFLFCRKSHSIQVMNMRTFNKVYYTAPDFMINRFDLRIWVYGFLAAKDNGWGEIL